MSYFNKEDYTIDKKSKNFFFTYWFLTSFFIVLSIIILLLYGLKIVEVYNYNEIEGKIISTRIIETRGSKNKRLYNPEIIYEYYINEDKYIGKTYDRLNFEKGYTLSTQILMENKVDWKTKVYINPYNKHETVLKKDIYPYYLLLLTIFLGVVFYWFILFHMYRTDNYYIMHTKDKKKLVFAYPTAIGFALICIMNASFAFSFIAIVIHYNLRWSFYILWIFALIITFYFAYYYKKYNLEFSDKFNDKILESEELKLDKNHLKFLKSKRSERLPFLIISVSLLLLFFFMIFLSGIR